MEWKKTNKQPNPSNKNKQKHTKQPTHTEKKTEKEREGQQHCPVWRRLFYSIDCAVIKMQSIERKVRNRKKQNIVLFIFLHYDTSDEHLKHAATE